MSKNSPNQNSLMLGICRRFTSRVGLFSRSDSGTVTVESVIILPLLFFGVMATFAYFDAYRKQSLALKANYAIADYLSRNYKYDQSTVDGLDKLFQYMSHSSDESWIRITVVGCSRSPAKCNDQTPRKLDNYRIHSAESAPADSIFKRLRRDPMREYLGPHIPKMYKGEKLFVVETHAKYRPLFPGNWTGIYSREFSHIVVTGSREYDDLCFDGRGNSCPPPAET